MSLLGHFVNFANYVGTWKLLFILGVCYLGDYLIKKLPEVLAEKDNKISKVLLYNFGKTYPTPEPIEKAV